MEQKTLDLLQKNQKTITKNWMEILLEDESMREDLVTNDELREQSEELVAALVQAFKSGNFENIESEEYESVLEIISGLSNSRAKQGYSPRETGLYVLSMKEAFTNFLIKSKGEMSPEFYNELMELNRLIDKLSIITFDTYIKGREEVIMRQTDELEEISTPVIRVWEGIVALPIIGTLDSARTQKVMENLLNEIVATGSSIAILDISGVPTVDSLVAQHLIKTVRATRLMGADCVISGIKPEIAQTVVHLGIDLTNVETKSTLSSALRFAFKRLSLKVVKDDK
jgi:rsbT co-antagonist protein RsbR